MNELYFTPCCFASCFYVNQHFYFKITGLQIKRKKKRRKRKRNGKKKNVVKNYARKMKTMVKGHGKL